MADGILTPCNVARSWYWFRQVTAACNVACGSGIVTVNLPSGMTCHWIRPNARHIAILHLVSISTTSPQSTCHSEPVSEILSKSDHPRQKKMTSCRFSRWQISGILDFMNSKMGALKNLLTKLLSFPENRVFAFCRQDPRWRISAILDFRGLIMGSLKSPCTTSYWSSIETIALKCLIFQKIAFFCILATNRWTAPMH